jgi:hypothetical protein
MLYSSHEVWTKQQPRLTVRSVKLSDNGVTAPPVTSSVDETDCTVLVSVPSTIEIMLKWVTGKIWRIKRGEIYTTNKVVRDLESFSVGDITAVIVAVTVDNRGWRSSVAYHRSRNA